MAASLVESNLGLVLLMILVNRMMQVNTGVLFWPSRAIPEIQVCQRIKEASIMDFFSNLNE